MAINFNNPIDGLYYSVLDNDAKTLACQGLAINDTTTTEVIIHSTIEDTDGDYTVTEIASYSSSNNGCFKNKTNITHITIPETIEGIGDMAFSGCSGITNVYYTGSLAKWCFINFIDQGSNPLDNETASHTIHFYVNNNIEYFNNNDTLTITNEFDTLIQNKEFNGIAFGYYFKSRIQHIILDNQNPPSNNFKIVGSNSLTGGNTITEDGNEDKILIYKDTVLFGVKHCLLEDLDQYNITTIGFGAFYGSPIYPVNHTTLFIPESVKIIKRYAFFGEGYYLSMPLQLENYEGERGTTFGGAYLSAIDNTVRYFCNFERENVDRTTPIINKRIIIESNRSNADDFNHYYFSIPDGVRVIGNAVFSRGGTNDNHKNIISLAYIDIPDSVVSIHIQAFQGNAVSENYDSTIIYKEDVSVLYNNKVYRCKKAFTVAGEADPDNTTYWEEREPYLLINSDKEDTDGYKKNTTLSNIKYLGTQAFYNSNLNNRDSTLTISKDLKIIPKYAFSLTGIKNILFEAKSNCTIIDQSSFSNSDLENITLPNSIKQILKTAFYNTKLKSLVIPSSVKILENDICKNCSLLESITFNNNYIPYGCCMNDFELKKVIINGKITRIESYAFANCGKLTELHLPNSLKEINTYLNQLSDGVTGNGIQDIYYEGREGNWNKIQKSAHWDESHTGINAWTIHFWKGMVYQFNL